MIAYSMIHLVGSASTHLVKYSIVMIKNFFWTFASEKGLSKSIPDWANGQGRSMDCRSEGSKWETCECYRQDKYFLTSSMASLLMVG